LPSDPGGALDTPSTHRLVGWYTDDMVRVIDAAHFLADGDLPAESSPVRREALVVARLIEYAGPLERGESCVALIECPRRPGRRPCRELLWVHRERDDRIVASCPRCGELLYLVSNWRSALWSDGPMVLPRHEGPDGALRR
jgi:hypothetical protein